MSAETMEELHHCRDCGQDKPASEMRRDSSYASGFRPQCRACKQKKERKQNTSVAKTATKTAPPKKKAAPKPQPVPAEDRLYPCARCERDDVPFSEMTKDRRKYMGVGSWCLKCRRERDAEIRLEVQAKQAEEEAKRKAVEAEQLARKRGYLADEWEFCYRCNAKARPGILRQPPPHLASGYPEDATLCAKCLGRAGDRADMVRLERQRMGLPENPSRKELESAARVAALRELAQTYEEEYRRIYRRFMDSLGLEPEKKWITL